MVEIDVTRAARLLNCSRYTVYRLLDSGSIDGYQLCTGGWWRVYYDSVVHFVQRRRGQIPSDLQPQNEPAQGVS